MSIVLGILEFIFSFFAIVFTWFLILNIINSVTNPQIVLDEKGNAFEKNDKARIWFSIIIAFCWAAVIVIP
jgi:hypothetical protein